MPNPKIESITVHYKIGPTDYWVVLPKGQDYIIATDHTVGQKIEQCLGLTTSPTLNYPPTQTKDPCIHGVQNPMFAPPKADVCYLIGTDWVCY
jgi:hypothetical protein